MPASTEPRPPLCPSAQPAMEGAVAFGIVGGTPDEPWAGYLREPLPVSSGLLDGLPEGVQPTEVFRFGAPCAGSCCRHFDGSDCRLAGKLVQLMPAVSSTLPACALRPDCRWWRQEGKAACYRCPQVVTLAYDPGDALRQAADPDV